MNKISVIIATYNRADSIKDTLDCLYNQNTNNDFEYDVIVVDNHSKDHTKEAVESCISQFQGRLIYLFESRQGKPYALNQAITVAQGEILVFVDDDCLLEPDYLWNVFQAFQKCGPETGTGLIGGKIEPFWVGGSCPAWLKPLFDQPARFADGTFNRDKIGFEGALGIFDLGDEPIVLDYSQKGHLDYQFFGANMAILKRHLQESEPFNVTKRYGQDTDICLRLLNRGIKGVYVPMVKLRHKIPVSKVTFKYYYRWWYIRGVYSDLSNVPGKILIQKLITNLFKSIAEKDLLSKIKWRNRCFYHLGQLKTMFFAQIDPNKLLIGRGI